jgi:hypothetical protein
MCAVLLMREQVRQQLRESPRAHGICGNGERARVSGSVYQSYNMQFIHVDTGDGAWKQNVQVHAQLLVEERYGLFSSFEPFNSLNPSTQVGTFS